uniref:DUF5745 domain-containing protein n=1 Tax=Euplotes harpa TaxID=151035 RepID=A0A7S3J5F8_9SPIT|mmetsp:Transcript_2119/g.2716  ORF Transcript_2119/g.2716 Transcript_2119/m.2716 type:complete len:640 (+) Transcript_2119:41-1960(+)
MMDDEEEVTEERVLELGNKVLEVLGAEDKITEIEHFQMDSLYLQLFQALFPQFDFEHIEPGNNEEEMAENINALIKLLETNISTDLSDIKAESIVSGDLVHIDEFLQVLLQVVFLMVQNQGEGEESEESMGSMDHKREDTSSKKDKKANAMDNLQDLHDFDDDLDDFKDIKAKPEKPSKAAELDVNSPELNKSDRKGKQDHDNEDDEPRFSDLDLYGKNPPDHKQVMIDDDEGLMMKQGNKHASDNYGRDQKASPGNDAQKKASDAQKQPDSKNAKDGRQAEKEAKNKVDVLNDPLLPDGVDFGTKKQKRQRADSLGGGGSFKGHNLLDDPEDENEDDLLVIDNLDELNEEQKYMVLQHLFEEYQKDPESFPEDQKELLEQEMMKLYQKAELEGELSDEDEYDEKHSDEKYRSDKKDYSNEKAAKAKQKLNDDSDDYEQEDSGLKEFKKNVNPRPLHDDSSDDQEYMNNMNNMNNFENSDHASKGKPEKEDKQEYRDSSGKKELHPQEESDHQEQMEEEQEEGEGDNAHDILNSEEFQNLSPEQQQQMIMALQQQEMEGEGEEGAPEVNQEYLNALQQQELAARKMRKYKTKGPKKVKKKRPSTAKYGLHGGRSKMSSKLMRRPGTASQKRKNTSKLKK